MRLRIFLPLVVLASAALAVGACGGQNAGKLSVSAKGMDAAAVSGKALQLANGIAIDRVRVAVKEVELEGGTCVPAEPSPMPGSPGVSGVQSAHEEGSDHPDGGQGHEEDGEDHDHDCEVELGPFGIDLSGDQLAGPVTQVFDGQVPPGTYHELEIKICPVDANRGAFFAEMNGASVIVDGSVTVGSGEGTVVTPFTLSFPICAELERETKIVVEPGGQSANVTLSFDPSAWFAGPNGATLDPTKPEDQAAIAANVRAAFDAFEDEDRDGHCDG